MADKRNFTALEWVSGEIGETLKQASEALEAFVSNKEDATRIRFCLNHIHQVHNILQMVELHGGALLAEEMEKLSQALIDKTVVNTSDAYEVLMRAILQLPIYLDRVKTVRTDDPASLMALLNDLRAVRGEHLFTETQLFSPDMRAARTLTGARANLTEQKFAEIMQMQRKAYESAMVKVLRDRDIDACLPSLKKVFSNFTKICQGRARAALWDVCLATIEGIENDTIPGSIAINNLLRQVDKEIRHMAHGGVATLDEFTSDELIKNLLYYIARSQADSPLISQIRETYKLDRALPGFGSADGTLGGAEPDAMKFVVMAVCEEFAKVKTIFDNFVAGRETGNDSLQAAIAVFKQTGDTLAVLGLGEMRKKLEQLAASLQKLLESGSLVTGDDLMDAAASLLEVETSLNERYNRDAVTSDDGTPRSMDHAMMSAQESVLLECHNGLEQAKDAIVEYIGSQWDPSRIADIPNVLQAVRGGLEIVGQRRAARILGACGRYIKEQLIDGGIRPDFTAMDTLADALTSIEYYLECLDEDVVEDTNATLELAERSVAALGYAVAAHQRSTQAAVIEADQIDLDHVAAAPVSVEEVEQLAAQLHEQSDEALLAELVSATADLPTRAAAGTPGLEAVEATPADAEAIEPEPVAEPEPALEAEAVAPAAVEPPSVVAAAPAPSAPVAAAPAELPETCDDELVVEDLDDEIAEIFIEEAQEVMENINEFYPNWRANFDDKASLTEFRRGFHTLKGSGRMAKALQVGELAWSVENMLNRIIDGSIEPDERVCTVIDAVIAKLPSMIDAFSQRKMDPQPALSQRLYNAASALSRGEPMPSLEANAAAPVAEETAVVEPAALAESAEVTETLEPAEWPELAGTEAAEEAIDLAETIVQAEEVELAESAAEDAFPETIDIPVLAEEPEAPPMLAEEAIPVLEPEAMDIPVIADIVIDDMEDMDADFDYTLWEIFASEAEMHLEVADEWLAYARERSPIPVETTDPLQRALHTLKGSAHMAEVTPIAELATPFEKFVKELRAYQIKVSDDFANLLADVVTEIRLGIEMIEKHKRVVLPNCQVLLDRTAAMRLQLTGGGDVEATSKTDAPPPELATVDPARFNHFLINDMDALMNVLPHLEAWQDHADGTGLDRIVWELEEMAAGAELAGLHPIASLARAIAPCYAHARSTHAAFAAWRPLAEEAHDALIDFMDRMAASEDLSTNTDLESRCADFLAGTYQDEELEAEAEPVAEPAPFEEEAAGLEPAGEAVPAEDLTALLEPDLSALHELEEAAIAIDESAVATSVPAVPVHEQPLYEASQELLDMAFGDAHKAPAGPAPALESAEAETVSILDDEPLVSEDFLATADMDTTSHVDEPAEATELAAADADIETAAESAEATAVSALAAETAAPGAAGGILAYSDDLEPELLDIFLDEANDLVEELEQIISDWQEAPDDRSFADALRRNLHTLKGGARMSGLTGLGSLAHDLETQLEQFNGMADSALFAEILQYQDCILAGIEQGRALAAGQAPQPMQIALPGAAAPAPALAEEWTETVAPVVSEEPAPVVEEVEEIVLASLPEEPAIIEMAMEEPGLDSAEPPIGEAEAIAPFETEEEIAVSVAVPEPELVEDSTLPAAEILTPAPSAAPASKAAATVLAYSDDLEPELLDIFLEEASDLVEELEQIVEDWQGAPDDRSFADALRRNLHTLKGGARMAGLTGLGSLAHDLETQLEQFSGIADSALFAEILQYQDCILAGVEQGRALARGETPAPMTCPLPGAAGAAAEAPAAAPVAEPAMAEAIEPPSEPLQPEAAPVELAEAEEPVPVAEAPTLETVPAESAPVETAPVDTPQAEVEPTAVVPAKPAIELGMSADIDAELLGIFIDEADELLEDLDAQVRGWQEAPDDRSFCDALKRTLHTYKGGARMAGIMGLGELAHDLETQLEQFSGVADASLFETLHRYQDQLLTGTGWVRRIAAGETLDAILGITSAAPAATPAEVAPAASEVPAHTPEPAPASREPEAPRAAANSQESPPSAVVIPFRGGVLPTGLAEAAQGKRYGQTTAETKASQAQQEMIKVSADLLESLVNLAGETSINRSRIEQQLNDIHYSANDMDGTINRLQDLLRRLKTETDAQIQSRISELQERSDDFDPLEMDRYSTLQQLTSSLSESASDLIDIRNSLNNKLRDTETLLIQQSRINTDLQEGLMRSRMVPFSRLEPRLRRIVRQVAGELKKEISFDLENVQGELDRTMLERMVAPLEHMLRNACDHGVETPEKRVAAGKPRQGRIVLSLGREGGDILISLKDDGGGINVDVIRKKAIERGLLAADAHITDSEALQFILQAGFSTAEKVTQISGRGVGMDVVHSEIKAMGGTMTIHSAVGKGSEFIVRLPFTVSVNRALMVRTAEELYAVPLNSIEGIVRVSPYELESYYDDAEARFEYANRQYEIRYLGALLHTRARPNLDGITLPEPVILLRGMDHTVALHVDQLVGSREIVVKSLGPQFASVPGLSGATLLGDGSVVPILDLPGLVRANFALPEVGVSMEAGPAEPVIEETITVMVCDDSVTVRKVTSRLLEREGFEVMLAKDGADALLQMQDKLPDVLLLDIEMPRMDGFEVASSMKSSQRMQDIPIIMITSRTGEKHRERAVAMGVERYMGKPYVEDELLMNINDLVGERLARRMARYERSEGVENG